MEEVTSGVGGEGDGGTVDGSAPLTELQPATTEGDEGETKRDGDLCRRVHKEVSEI